LNALHHLSFVSCNHHVDLIFLVTKPSASDNVILSNFNASNNFSGHFSHLKIAIDCIHSGDPYIIFFHSFLQTGVLLAAFFHIRYTVVKDPLNNADIHKGSGGNYFCLYITKDPKAGKPIKELKTLSTREFLTGDNIVKYCSRKTKYNKPFEPLDCNRGRDSIIRFTPQNYIFIVRD
jgi:hypothetical protein